MKRLILGLLFIPSIVLGQAGISMPGNNSPRFGFNKIYQFRGGSPYRFLDSAEIVAILPPILTGGNGILKTGNVLSLDTASIAVNKTFLSGYSYTKSQSDIKYGILANSNTWSNTNLFQRSALGGTSADGIILENPTAAISGSQQVSPTLRLSSKGWGTTAGTSQNVDFNMWVLPLQGATPTGAAFFQFKIGAAAATTAFSIDNTGGLTLPTSGSFKGNTLTSTANDNALLLQTRSFTTANTAVSMAIGTATNTTGLFTSVKIAPVINQTGTASATDLLVNRTQTAVGSGAQNLLDLQVNTVSKFKVDNAGLITGTSLNLSGNLIAAASKLTSTTYSTTNQGIFIGDSFTDGVPGPTTTANRYSTITANLTGATEINYGIGSSTMQKGTPVNPLGGTNMQDRLSNIPTKTASQLYLVFQFGDNDFGYNGGTYDTVGYKSAYRVALNNAISKGWVAQDIYLLSPTYMTTAGFAFYASINGGTTPTLARLTSYVQATSAIAVEFGTNYIDLYQTMLNNGGTTLLHTDGLHANNAGARVIANALYAKISDNYSPLPIKDNQGNTLATILNKAGISGLKLGSNNKTSLVSPTSIDLGGSYNANTNDPVNAKLKIVSNGDGIWGFSADATDGLTYFSGSGKHKIFGDLAVTGTITTSGNILGNQFISSGANSGYNFYDRTGGVNFSSVFSDAGFIKFRSSVSGSTDLLTINETTGGINASSLTASQAVFTDASKNLVSNAILGTGSVVMSSSLAGYVDLTTDQTITSGQKIFVTSPSVPTPTFSTTATTAINQAYLPLGVPAILTTLTGVDTKTSANYSMYTVPSGKTAVITAAIVRCTAATSITNGPSVSLNVAGVYDIYANTALSALQTNTDVFGFSTVGMSKVITSGNAVTLSVNTIATGTAQTVEVTLIGYLR